MIERRDAKWKEWGGGIDQNSSKNNRMNEGDSVIVGRQLLIS